MRLIKAVGRFSNVIIAVCLLSIIGGLIFFYSFPFNVAEFKKINILGDSQAGSQLQYKLDFCRYVPKGTQIQVSRFLIPKDKELTNPIELSSNPTLETLDGIIGCRTSEIVRLPIEISAPEGEYKLLIRAKYCIEFAFVQRCIPIEQYSDYFNITRPSIPDQLSAINEQLETISSYIENNADSSTGNVKTPKSLQVPTPPTTDAQRAQPQSSSEQTPSSTPPSQQSLLNLKSGIIELQIGIPKFNL